MQKNLFEKESFIRGLHIVYVVSICIHLTFLFLFFKEGHRGLQSINLIFPCIFIYSLILNIQHKFETAAIIALSAATLHGFLNTWFVGWNSGFYYSIMLGYILIFFMLRKEVRTKLLLAVPITCALLVLYLATYNERPLYVLSDIVLKYIHIFNLLVTIGVVCTFALYYTYYLSNAEKVLKTNLLEMENTQMSLRQQIIENQSMQEELVRENAFLDALMDNLPDYIYFKDTESRFTRISRSMLKLFPSDKLEDMIGKTDMDVHLSEVALEFKHDEEQVMRTRKGIIDKVQHEFILNGIEQWVSTTKLPLINEHGECIGTFGISKDITYLKKLELEAQDQAIELRRREVELKKKEKEQRLLNQQKIKFFSVFSHDLKNPLNTLVGFTALLWEKYDVYDEAAKKKMIRNLVKLSDNMQGLIMNLLDWSRSQLDNIAVHPININLREVLEDILKLYNYQQSQKEIVTHILIDNSMEILADIDIVKTVFRNIYFNAIKFTHIKGKIEISASKTQNELQIVFKDNGIGMTPEEKEALFTLGEASSQLGTMNERGTGLGLIVCQEYLSKCNGYIKVESQKNMGSSFIVCLPVLPEVNAS